MRQLIGVAAVWVASVAQVGCYSLQPRIVQTAPLLGSRIAVDINDAGRLALGGLMGAAIGQIEGRLVAVEGDTYELAVTTVHFLRGGEQIWTGERVLVKQEYVTQMYDRQFSKGRTIIISAAAAGVVVYFAGKAIVGSLSGDDGMLADDSAEAVRRPARRPIRP
ncbi:MAG: hypothetical protein O2973_09250 [Gemmatimonadetes bacterium]|nr:hypothetical protein [Gemmatimonadota bacterium]